METSLLATRVRTRVLVALLAATIAASANLSGGVNLEITNGTSEGYFSPDRNVSRGELATFIWRYAGEPAAGSEQFTDVNPRASLKCRRS